MVWSSAEQPSLLQLKCYTASAFGMNLQWISAMLFPGHNCCPGPQNHILSYSNKTWYCRAQGRCAQKEGGRMAVLLTHTLQVMPERHWLDQKPSDIFHHLQQALEWILNEFQAVAGWSLDHTWKLDLQTHHLSLLMGVQTCWDVYKTFTGFSNVAKCRKVQCKGCKENCEQRYY